MTVKRRPRGRLKQSYLLFTDTNLLRHRHNSVPQHRVLLPGGWAGVSPGHNIPFPVQEGAGVFLGEGAEHLQHPSHAVVNRQGRLRGGGRNRVVCPRSG